MTKPLFNAPAPNTSYFTPAQSPPSGTANTQHPNANELPLLFQPLRIRGLEFHNRIVLAPMAQYSADNGALTAWHTAHLGSILLRGPGLSFIEATAVTADGRITPEDSGLWSDDQIAPIRALVEFAHSQNQKIGIQLVHSGRKGSTVPFWLSFGDTAVEAASGWPNRVRGATNVAFSPTFPETKAMTVQEIKEVVKAFVDSTKRALKAGVDVIEIHNAHGFLLNEFLSPITNDRTDEYGGSFENRIRLTLAVVDAMRAVMPLDMPLFLRISATEWLEDVYPESWQIADTVRLAGILAEHGVDLIDISSGGNHVRQHIKRGPLLHDNAYQAHLSEVVKKAHGDKIFVSAVGGIKTGTKAEEVLQKGQADLVFIGRQFLKDPATVWTFAEELGVDIKVANQIEWGFRGRGSSRAKELRN